jgi:enoyl-CoA hydratase
MSKTQVRIEIDGSHAVITFFTEDGLNVLSPDVLHSFGAAVAKVKRDPHVRTTVIQAEGKVFLAGADVKVMANYGAEDAREYGAMGQGVLNDLAAIPSVSIVAINGAALGGGLELALACDFRVAVKSAKLGLPEVSLGLIPGWGGIIRLTKLIGPSRAKRLYLSGLPVSADDGYPFGLVDEVVNSVEDLGPRVAALCKSLRRASPAAVALAKRAARDMDDLRAFADCFHTTDCREGMAAFLEKRPASWME